MSYPLYSFRSHTVASWQQPLPSCFSPPGKMAASVVVRSSGPALCPSFAEVCSFLERYGAALDLPEMTFPEMERYLRDTTTGERTLLCCCSNEKVVETCDTWNRRSTLPPLSWWWWIWRKFMCTRFMSKLTSTKKLIPRSISRVEYNFILELKLDVRPSDLTRNVSGFET